MGAIRVTTLEGENFLLKPEDDVDGEVSADDWTVMAGDEYLIVTPDRVGGWVHYATEQSGGHHQSVRLEEEDERIDVQVGDKKYSLTAE